MKYYVIYILSVFFIIPCGFGNNKSPSITQKDSITHTESNKESLCLKMNGKIFQYLRSPDMPEHLFTLIFHCQNDTLKGIIFGPDPEGDNGLYFFKSNLDSITLNSKTVRFSFLQGDLYEHPYTLENYYKHIKNDVLGESSCRLIYTGYFHSDTIKFICTSLNSACYADTMNFIERQKK